MVWTGDLFIIGCWSHLMLLLSQVEAGGGGGTDMLLPSLQSVCPSDLPYQAKVIPLVVKVSPLSVWLSHCCVVWTVGCLFHSAV